MRENSPQKKALLIFSGLLLFIFIGGCAKREIVNVSSGGKTIVCFGDSITFGYGAKPGEDYPTALARLVRVPVINAGIDGDTSTEALQRIRSDAIDRDPFLVIIEFGGNDFLRKTPIETTMDNVRQMVEEVQASGAMVAVVDISAGLFLKEYRGAYRRLAYETGAIFIPNILNKIVTNPSMKSDFLHPNGKGYQMIAQRIFRSIEPYLKPGTLLSRK
ncbi:MAG: GDSL-type esterase/lipase family protein [Candidatus Omnitrophota bacterium]